MADRWAYWDAINDVYHGLSRERVRALYAEADGLINLCGATRLREDHLRCPVRIMIDTDPVYEQIKYAKADPQARAYLGAPTHFFTYGANLGTDGAGSPCAAFRGARPDRPSISIRGRARQAHHTRGRRPRFTTICDLGEQGQEQHRVRRRHLSVWSKAPQLSQIPRGLPRATPANLAFRWRCCRPTNAVRQKVEGAGWSLVDPRPISADMAMTTRRSSPRLARRVHGGQGHLRAEPNRGWFSDPRGVLPGGRPAGRDDADRFHQLLHGRARLDSITRRHAEARSPRSTQDTARLSAQRPCRARPRRRMFRRRPGDRRAFDGERAVKTGICSFSRHSGLTEGTRPAQTAARDVRQRLGNLPDTAA